jgi:hypothetical protein
MALASCFGERLLQLRVFSRQHQHHLGRGAIAPLLLGHDAYRFVDVREERFVARTQVIQPWLTIGGFDEAVLGALAVTGEAHFPLAAVAR